MLAEKPKVSGLSKSKLWIIFSAFGLSLVGVFLYFAAKDNGVQKDTSNQDQQQQNYAKPNNSSVDDIVGKGNQNASAPVVKITASAPSSMQQSEDAEAKKQAEALKQAMRTPLASNQIKPQNAGGGSSGDGNTSPTKNDDPNLPKDDQNQQAEKRAFIAANSKGNVAVKNRIADMVLSMGTKIPAQVDQDINSDLPGQIYGHITRDVYDSRTNSKLLIPAGSNVVGTYDSSVAYGQERLLVAWTRINMPNGQYIDLPGFGGADWQGAGFGDLVDNHYDKIFGATVLISILAAGAQLAQPQQSNALQAPGIGQTIGQSVGTQIAQTGTTIMNKNLNLQPTLHIRPGFEFTIEVNKDMVFQSPYIGNKRKMD